MFTLSGLQRWVTPLTGVLLTFGLILLWLSWLFADFFSHTPFIDPYSWLPLLALLAVLTLLLARHWRAGLQSLLSTLIILVGCYYLLLGIGVLPAPILLRAVLGAVLLVLLNGKVIWFSRRALATQKLARKDMLPARRSALRWMGTTTASLALGGLFVKTYFWDDPDKRWLIRDLFARGDAGHKLTLASPLATRINDASHLNSSVVSEIRSPRSVAEVFKAIQDARTGGKHISLSGIRHSMGGQAFGLKTLHLDMTHLDTVRYNPADQTVTVGPGATWRQIQETLSPHRRAVRVMQDSNIFSVGGSLSVNAHGKDPHYGSLIESVNYLKIVTADGRETLCSKTQQRELFTAVIGGYGLFGVITEVSLLTTPNMALSFSLQASSSQNLIETLERINQKAESRLVEAHLSVDMDHFLDEALIYTYAETNAAVPADELTGENSVWLRKVVFQASRNSNFGKIFRWQMEKIFTPLLDAKTLSRNTAMAVPVRFLENPDSHSTDVLQEYFVPTAQASAFLENYKRLLRKHKIHLLNVTVRKVRQDTDALLSYAQEDMYGFVVYYKVYQTSLDKQRLQLFTRELVQYLLTIKATYYLCYGSYYTPAQLVAMYPTVQKLFTLKKQYDPESLFTSLWYEQYWDKVTAVE